MARGIRGVLVECHLYFSESPVCPLPACIGCIIVRSLLLAGAANSESIVPGPRDWLATYVFLPLRRWHYKFPCKPLICFSQSHSLYYLDLLLALLGSNLRGRGCCCVQVVRTWLRSSMIVKTEEDPLKEADIMVENFVDHVIMEVGTTRSISSFTFSDSKCLQSAPLEAGYWLSILWANTWPTLFSFLLHIRLSIVLANRLWGTWE